MTRIFKLEDGTRVRVVGHADGSLDYEVYGFFPQKVTTATGTLTGEEASQYHAALTVADGLRFARQFGAQAPGVSVR